MKIGSTIASIGLLALTANPFVAAASCASNCIDLYKPVCASDGHTYTNQCYFDVQKCSTNDSSLTVVSDGECDSIRSAVGGCERGCIDVYKPVCGSDGTTYKNECELNNAKCANASLTKVSDGECASAPSCLPVICTALFKPICGSDGKIYANSCLFKVAQCKNPSLTIVIAGECGVSTTEGNVN